MELIMKRNKKEKKNEEEKTYLSVDIFCVKNTQKKMYEKKKIFMHFVLVLFSYDHHYSKNPQKKRNQ